MGVACTLALTQDRAFHLWVRSKPLPAMVKTASLALGEIPSVPEKGPSPKRAPEKGPSPKRARPRKGPVPEKGPGTGSPASGLAKLNVNKPNWCLYPNVYPKVQEEFGLCSCQRLFGEHKTIKIASVLEDVR